VARASIVGERRPRRFQASRSAASVAFVGLHDALHERMAHDVSCREERERDTLDVAQHVDRA
jgi:hypothetical protein